MAQGTRQFRILGPVAALNDDGEAVALGGAQQRCFLALLLLSPNRVVSIDGAVDAIWGENPPATARTILHGYASKLRMVVQPAARLVTRAPGYILEVEDGALDASRFSALVERGRELISAGDLQGGRQELESGLSLWHGVALEDLRYEPALAEQSARLEELRVAALEERIDADIELGRHAEVTPELQELVGEHPLRERLAGLLMLALYRSGRQAEASAVYDDLRRQLAGELGLSPGSQVEGLHTAMLRGDTSVGGLSPQPARVLGHRTSHANVAMLVVGAVTIVAAVAAIGIALSSRGSGNEPRALIPKDERLPFAAVPNELLGSYDATIPAGQSAQTMTLRASDDPICKPLLAGHGTCFLIHPVANELDPGARGQAAFHDGMVVLRYVRIPFIPGCEREIDRYRVAPDGEQLTLDERVIVSGPFDDCTFSRFTRSTEP